MDRLESLALKLNAPTRELIKMLIDQAYFSSILGTNTTPIRPQYDPKPTPIRPQKSPNPSRRRASSPSVKNKNNNNTNSLSKNPTLKAGKISDKDAGEPKAEKETPPRQTHKFFVGLLGTFGEEHPEYLTEAVKAAWSEFVTHRQGLDTKQKFGTKTAALGVLKKLHKLSSKMKEPAARAVELLRVATEMRWMTVFEAKEEPSAAKTDEERWQETLRRNMQG
jgi:hypothetical protein